MTEPFNLLPSIAKLASKHGIAPLKSLGQNFIFDIALCDRIVKASEMSAGDNILEIGPGPAGLTRSILSRNPSKLTVVETDIRCIPLLKEISIIYPNIDIINMDALEFDIHTLQAPIIIISNLPYNIGTELIIRWFKKSKVIKNMTVMLQSEVVDRICAKPGTKSYGRLSIISQLCCKVEKCFNVSSKAFYPSPKVESAIVKLTPLTIIPADKVLRSLEKVTAAAFGMRRKMIKTSLKSICDSRILAALDIDEKLRAENLSPAQFLSIAKKIVDSSSILHESLIS